MMPLLPYFLLYVSGLTFAFPASRDFILPFLVPLATFLAGCALLTRMHSRRYGLWLLALLIFTGGLTAPGWKDWVRPDHHIFHHLQPGKRAEITGILKDPPQASPDRVRYTVELESIRYDDRTLPASGRARITDYRPEKILEVGDRVRFSHLRLKRPRNFKNPGRFDYQRFMRFQGIDVIGGFSKPTQIQKLASTGLFPVHRFFQSIRRTLMESLDRNLAARAAALAKGMVLGQKQFLDEDLREAYAATGMAHLLAVSGLHIGFVAGGTYALIFPILFGLFWKRRRGWALSGYAKKAAVAGCLVPVLFYLELVSTQLSAIRAGTMVLVFLVAVLVDREKHFFNALMIAAWMILIWKPGALLDVGFQLSFTAVLTILYANRLLFQIPQDPIDRLGDPPWYRRLPGLNPEARSVKEKAVAFVYGTASVSAAAILATLPILVFHFNRVSLIGFFLNLILVPLASILIPLTLLFSCVGLLVPGWGDSLLQLLGPMMNVFVALPTWAAQFPFTSQYVPTPPTFWLLLYYTLLFGVPLYLHRYHLNPAAPPKAKIEKPIWQAGMALCALGLVIWFAWPRFPLRDSNQLEVVMLDVGQGESLFIEFPDHRTMLIDGGGFYKDALDVGRAVVARFLWHRGIGKLDYLVATHSDHDHISGLLSLSKFFPVTHFLNRDPTYPDRRIDLLRRNLLKQGTQSVPVRTGEKLIIGDVHLTPLHPSPEFVASIGTRPERLDNDLSWIWKLEYGEVSLLLTGDITETAENYLVKTGAPVNADFLKAPHHGSRHSNTPEFLKAVGAREVWVSSGYLNPFHHPHSGTLERYRQAGTRVRRTDLEGALHLVTDGKSYALQTHENL